MSTFHDGFIPKYFFFLADYLQSAWQGDQEFSADKPYYSNNWAFRGINRLYVAAVGRPDAAVMTVRLLKTLVHLQ